MNIIAKSQEQAEYDVRQTSPSRESQAADSKSSEGILRPDVLSLGFHAFDDLFDSERILLLHVPSSEKDGSDEIYFFHHEGMALLFGVGVPHSKVMLKSDSGGMAVYEVGETVWTQLWMSTKSPIGSLILVDSKPRIEDVHAFQGAILDGVHTSHVQEARSKSSSDQHLSLSPQQNLLFPFASFLNAFTSSHSQDLPETRAQVNFRQR
ncbi:hypothetical protein R1flu_004354 [Riccia fluitans]|uniref:Uncharacterized protein n=1 Tax=Riccia fluitans TaxID=41844 RepID=A0ABD1YQU7_9MARC